MRVLVTGADGFAGPYVAEALAARGHTVTAMARQAGRPRHPAIASWHFADLVDLPATRAVVADARPDAVVHLAAISFVGHANVLELYTSNVVGTRNLLEALSDHALAGQAIIASSANVYGNRTAGPLHEGLQPDPRSDYALSKLACEHIATMYGDRVPSVIVRPFNYTGVGQSDQFIIPKIVGHTRIGAAEIELGNLEVARDFSDVRFFAEAIARLVETPKAQGQTVNICSGRAVTLIELLALVAELSDHRMVVRTNPSFVRAQEVERLWGDDRLLQQLIGPISGPTLAETLEWMLRAK